MSNNQLALFDYGTLDPESRIVVQQEDKEFDRNMGDAGTSFIRACHNLRRIHEALKYKRPGFVQYCESKPGLSQKTAWKMLNVAEMLVENTNIPGASKEALYLLAAPSTPEAAREEAIQRASNGESISHARARVLVDEYREIVRQEQPASVWEPSWVGQEEPSDEEMAEEDMRSCGNCAHNDGNLRWESGAFWCRWARIEWGYESDWYCKGEAWQAEGTTLVASGEEEILEAAKRIREEKARVNAEQRATLAREAVQVPVGRYSCIVIDPPWPMEKINRDARPNQVGFDYPTMTEDELAVFPVPDIAADDCHLYLWTTHRFLPMAFRLAERWGFRYQCLMTWVKNVGFTPFSWMYSTEHVLFCRKGSLPLLRLGLRLDFMADVQEHSRKPAAFYDVVREASPGPRIDVFSRETHEGFEQYGNEPGRFAS